LNLEGWRDSRCSAAAGSAAPPDSSDEFEAANATSVPESIVCWLGGQRRAAEFHYN